MILPQPFNVEICTWEQQHQSLTDIRVTVFVDEQRVPAEIILDDADPACVHVIARDAGGAVIGGGRMVLLQPSGGAVAATLDKTEAAAHTVGADR